MSSYLKAASDVLKSLTAKTRSEAHRFMQYLYVYLLTTDRSSVFFLIQKQYLMGGKKQNTCLIFKKKNQTQQFALGKKK